MKQADRLQPPGAHLAKGQGLAAVRRQYDAGRVLIADNAGFQTCAQDFDLTGKQYDRSPLREPEGVFGGHGQRRDVVQRGLDRK